MYLIASDYDGTFCRYGRITKGDRAAVTRWRNSGNYFGFVTGRGEDFLQRSLDEGLEFDFLILHNGADIYDSQRKPLKHFVISEALIPALAECCEMNNGLRCNPEYVEGVFSQYYAYADTERECEKICAVINEKFSDTITAFQNGKNVNAVAKGVSKATGIAYIAELFGVKKENIASVGDTINDLPMLTEYNGYAMYTAKREIKALAPNRCSSIANLIKQLKMS